MPRVCFYLKNNVFILLSHNTITSEDLTTDCVLRKCPQESTFAQLSYLYISGPFCKIGNCTSLKQKA